MRILVTGASGLVGSALVEKLRGEGRTVNRMVRPGGSAAPGDVGWNPENGWVETGGLEGADAIVHLAGANIGEGRWTEARKKVLRASRVDSTRSLVNALAKLQRPPKAFVSASAVGYYGNRGDEILTEESAPGTDFLAQLARDWEAEAQRAEAARIRTVVLRFGVILTATGGALARMLFPFKLGAGGKIGSGRQWWSWLTLAEAVNIICFALDQTGVRGPVNAMAGASTNAEFTKALGAVLRRPTIFPLPGFAARLMLGEMADALLLSSARAVPRRLEQAGYRFLSAGVDEALRAVLRA
jgi:uncharacterized protein (TIGR01777 family)